LNIHDDEAFENLVDRMLRELPTIGSIFRIAGFYVYQVDRFVNESAFKECVGDMATCKISCNAFCGTNARFQYSSSH
jgi:hypothetical protein